MTEFNPFPKDPCDRVRQALKAIAAGEIVIMVDDEDRENEGDLVMAADKVTPESINFMAVHGRGLICLPMAPSIIDRLSLPMMVRDNASPYGTAFTVSIEARTGVSTGISAADRARTITVAVADDSKAGDIVSPGHVFPLRARSGGVLVRAGQTEGSVDLARLSGCRPAAVICEIMSEDGTMARLPELCEFAKKHQLRMLTVADLIAWRLKEESLVEEVAAAKLTTRGMGEVVARIFRNQANDCQYLALVKGELPEDGPVPVRVTSSNVWADALGAFRRDGGPITQRAMEVLGGFEFGVVLYILRPYEPDSILRHLQSVSGQIEGTIPPRRKRADPYPTANRDYGLGAQVLRKLGLRQLRLLTNSDRRLPGVEGYDIEVVDRIPVPTGEELD
jgi:3,4-dihydroxy 2-butanone 4-phosphate synthase / GTP cyclohydrolase II